MIPILVIAWLFGAFVLYLIQGYRAGKKELPVMGVISSMLWPIALVLAILAFPFVLAVEIGRHLKGSS